MPGTCGVPGSRGTPSGYCLVGEIPPPPGVGGWVGVEMGGWVSECLFFFVSIFFRHGKPRWGYVLMGPVTVWNRLTPTILVFEYLDPPSWRNWIFSALQTRLTEEPIYVTPPPSPPAHDRLRQDRSRLLSSSPLPPPSPSCCKRARLSTAL